MSDYKKVYLEVPFAEKDKVKSLGARWDAEVKKWYCSEINIALFNEWLITIDESKWIYPTNNKSLYVDLVPSSSWCNNLRSVLDKKDWDLIRKTTYRLAENRCELCLGVGSKHPVEAHERWVFDNENLIQKLDGVSCLCPTCHLATHFGLAQIQEKADIAANQLMKVNGWTEQQTEEHINESFKKWEFRSGFNWQIDISWLFDSCIPLSKNSLDNISHNGDYWTFTKEVIKPYFID